MRTHSTVFLIKVVVALLYFACAVFALRKSEENYGQLPQIELLDQWKLNARNMFYHGFNSYMQHAFPYDEIKPLSCLPRKWNDRQRGTLDDALGGYMLTLVDSLDTVALFGDFEKFDEGISHIKAKLHFDRNVTVSTFETNIRILGGLISSHLLATHPKIVRAYPPLSSYDGSLLRLAQDLGDRLLVAFQTPTGLPYHRINLRHGIDEGVSSEPHSCTAAAGTFFLEFFSLSKLTGNCTYEQTAIRALDKIWEKRSPLNIVGNGIDVESGHWREVNTGIGAGVDSFLEYMLKGWILSGNRTMLSRFKKLYHAVEGNMRFGDVHIEVSLTSGRNQPLSPVVSALQAFWPALQVMFGDVAQARLTYAPLWVFWRRHQALPDSLDLTSLSPLHFARESPLRPELIESAYHLYTATHDPVYVWHAKQIMDSIESCCRVKCGYASLSDVQTKSLDDRMDSFFLSETIKYLWLTFNEAARHASTAVAPQPCNFTECPQNSTGIPSLDGEFDDQESRCNREMDREGISSDSSASDVMFSPVDTIWTTEGHMIPLNHPHFSETDAITRGHDQCFVHRAAGLSDTTTSSHLVHGSHDFIRRSRRSYESAHQLMGNSAGTVARKVVKAVREASLAAAAKMIQEGQHAEVVTDMSESSFTQTFSKFSIAFQPQTNTWLIANDISWLNLDMSTLISAVAHPSSPVRHIGLSEFALHCNRLNRKCLAQASMINDGRTIVRLCTSQSGCLSTVAAGASFGAQLSRRGLQNLPPYMMHPSNACSDGMKPPANAPFIAFAVRGGCSFVDKARRVQQIGAAAIVILDEMAEEEFSDLPRFSIGAEEHVPEVTIPVMLIPSSSRVLSEFYSILPQHSLMENRKADIQVSVFAAVDENLRAVGDANVSSASASTDTSLPNIWRRSANELSNFLFVSVLQGETVDWNAFLSGK